jgi:hypothetical protein
VEYLEDELDRQMLVKKRRISHCRRVFTNKYTTVTVGDKDDRKSGFSDEEDEEDFKSLPNQNNYTNEKDQEPL